VDIMLAITVFAVVLAFAALLAAFDLRAMEHKGPDFRAQFVKDSRYPRYSPFARHWGEDQPVEPARFRR
jgi:hypothetical protein